MFILQQKLGCTVLVAGLVVPCLAQTNAGNATLNAGTSAKSAKVHTGISRKKSAAKRAPEPPPVVQEQAPPPPPPKRPYEESPVPPQVAYNGGQLTIIAPNSTLADILTAVRARTGTKVDYPPNASQERVALQVGPGSPRAVLTELLQGSPFDYILLGSDQDPNAVTQVMLMRREGPATGTGTAVASGNVPNQAPPQAEPSDEDADTDPAAAQAPRPLARPTPGQVVPGQPQQIGPPAAMQQAPEQNTTGTQMATPGQPAQPAAQDNGPKTPEQLLQQLQQMQRQEQQRQRPPR